MRIVSVLICVFLLYVGTVYAQTLSFSVDKTKIDINDSMHVTLGVVGTEGNGTIHIEGLDQFEVRNKATSQQIAVINGQRTQTTTLSVDLQPKTAGEFVLGPAHLIAQGSGKIASSQSFDVVVTGEKLFVSGTPQGWAATQAAKVDVASSDDRTKDEKTVFGGGLRKLMYMLCGVVVLMWSRKQIRKRLWKHKEKSPETTDQVYRPTPIVSVEHTYDKKIFIPNADTMIHDDILETQANLLSTVRDEVGKVVVGQERLIRNLLIALIAQGHILLEGVPGLAKTLSVETLSKVAGIGFGRVQFTPDLLPSDLTGTKVFNQQSTEFVTKKGPIFTNLLLADEINRAPAKVQSALLEAMAEKQVTIGDERLTLDDPFVVMATQNPLEQEGTYSLPEAQLDRFLLKTVIGYPTPEEEIQIMKQETMPSDTALEKLLNKKKIKELQTLSTSVSVAEGIYTYVKNLVVATREPAQNNCADIAPYISFGASPRASLALIKTAKVYALMQGRSYLLPEDIKELAHDVLRHRIISSYQAIADGVTTDDLVSTILERVAVVE